MRIFNGIWGLGFSEGKNMCKILVKCNILIKSRQPWAFLSLLLGGGFGGGSVGGVAGWVTGSPAGRLAGWVVGWQASSKTPTVGAF